MATFAYRQDDLVQLWHTLLRRGQDRAAAGLFVDLLDTVASPTFHELLTAMLPDMGDPNRYLDDQDPPASRDVGDPARISYMTQLMEILGDTDGSEVQSWLTQLKYSHGAHDRTTEIRRENSFWQSVHDYVRTARTRLKEQSRGGRK